MAEPKRSADEREEQLSRMAAMLAKGATQREIADAFDLAVSTVNRDVKLIRRRWEKEAAAKIDTWKGSLLAGHSQVIREAWREFERSKQDAQKIVEVTELVEDPAAVDANNTVIANGETVHPKIMSLTERTITTDGQTGDPRYLTVIVNAQAEQAKIIGAYAPVKQELGGRDGAAIPVQLIEIVPPEMPAPEGPQ